MADEEGVTATCSICQLMERIDPAEILWQDDYWIVAPFMEVPGWTLAMTKRHAEGIWSLSDEEAVRFGPMMRDVAAVVKQVTGAQRIHYAAMGEVAVHYHNAILPRLPGQKPVWDSMALVARGEIDADPGAASILRDEIRNSF